MLVVSIVVTLVLFTLGLFLCASLIPLITVIMLKLKKADETKKVYLFSSELFETEYPNTSHWHYLNEQYEKRKSEEFSKQLP